MENKGTGSLLCDRRLMRSWWCLSDGGVDSGDGDDSGDGEWCEDDGRVMTGRGVFRAHLLKCENVAKVG